MSGAGKHPARGWPGSKRWALTACLVLMVLFLGTVPKPAEERPAGELVRVVGGEFSMGDVFEEGRQNEQPVHTVALSDFFISRYEVTVTRFRAFVEDTGYRTSAEGPMDVDAHRAIMDQAMRGGVPPEELAALQERILRLSGAGLWDPEERHWVGYDPLVSWRTPGIAQGPNHPAVALSWDDAIRYCNWLSRKEGLPPAYDVDSGALLDDDGTPTSDVSRVRGFRLPTEAEWEFAARERGRRVRFGNGQDVARSTEMTFDAGVGDFPYLERGESRGRTAPVGRHPPNRLGLYGMSGNAWEWVSDGYGPYVKAVQTNPHAATGDRRVLRGGRWGGDAFEARVFHRSSWLRNDRCNNSGFRVARSASRED